jgi:diketogulonate reductase-like aldo/keto reductase
MLTTVSLVGRVLLVLSAASAESKPLTLHGDGTATSARGIRKALVYGTAWKKERTAELVLEAVRAGFRAIDTANMPKHYNETLVGTALKELFDEKEVAREDLFIQTKFTPDACDNQPVELHPYDVDADLATQVAQSFKSSLQHLGVDYVDSYVLHSMYTRHNDSLAVWRAMEAIQKSGGARQIGISNTNAMQLKLLWEDAEVKPGVVQNRCQNKDDWNKDVREYCDLKGVDYQGFWLLSGNRHVVSDAATKRIASAHYKTPQQVTFRFLMQGLGMQPLTGTKDSRHMGEDVDVAGHPKDTEGGFKLTEAEIKEMRAIKIKPGAEHSGKPVELNVVNKLRGRGQVHLFWLHPDTGELHPQGVLQAGGQTKLNSFHGHSFVAKIGGKDGKTVKHWDADASKGKEVMVEVDEKLDVIFHNDGTTTLSVAWLDHKGGEVPNTEIGAGGEAVINTFVGHSFVLRGIDDGVEVGRYEAQPASAGKQRARFPATKDELR